MLGISQDTVSEEDFFLLIKHFDADASGEIDGPEFQTLVQVLCCTGGKCMTVYMYRQLRPLTRRESVVYWYSIQ